MSSSSAMIMYLDAILVLKRFLQIFFKVDSIGPPFFGMPMPIVQLVRDARNGEY